MASIPEENAGCAGTGSGGIAGIKPCTLLSHPCQQLAKGLAVAAVAIDSVPNAGALPPGECRKSERRNIVPVGAAGGGGGSAAAGGGSGWGMLMLAGTVLVTALRHVDDTGPPGARLDRPPAVDGVGANPTNSLTGVFIGVKGNKDWRRSSQGAKALGHVRGGEVTDTVLNGDP